MLTRRWLIISCQRLPRDGAFDTLKKVGGTLTAGAIAVITAFVLVFVSLPPLAHATIFVSPTIESNAKSVELDKASRSERWLRLYQYESKTFNGFVSDIKSPEFFFSSVGQNDPLAEMTAAISAYEHPSLTFGIQKQSAACAFPARKKILEQILGRTFPEAECKDLKAWLSNLDAGKASLVFVGAYSGNPASILGHTFLRLANAERERTGAEGMDLLSYSIGFTAHTDPGDNRMNYIVKGITGGYPGYYDIEKHYMKVGLYNNSESRDLWDVPLNLSKDEVDLLAMHIWELTFNARFNYYFIDENCSYRLLKLLDAISPKQSLTDRMGTVVLPAETVRAAIDAGWADATPRFRSSVLRRMNEKLKLLDAHARALFERARLSKQETMKVDDATVIDALLDHWLYVNYKAKTALSDSDKAIMEATALRASQISASSRFTLTNEEIRNAEELTPPFLGHRPRWIQGYVGTNEHKTTAGLQYRSGTHPLWSNDPGYREVSAIEYLGLDLDWKENENLRWRALLVEAVSLEDFFGANARPSWTFSARAANSCLFCGTEPNGRANDWSTLEPKIQIAGGGGISAKSTALAIYILAHFETTFWMKDGAQAVLAPGAIIGLKLNLLGSTINAEISRHWWRSDSVTQLKTRFTIPITRDTNLFSQFANQSTLSGQSDTVFNFGGVFFFD